MMLKLNFFNLRESKTFDHNLNGSHSNNWTFENGTSDFSIVTRDIPTANNSTILSSVDLGNRGETEVGTIDARACQALNNLRPPTPDEQKSIQMVAELLISKDMITSFKSCIGQKNYKPFFDKYKRTLCKDLDNLPNVILKNETSMSIAQNMRKLIRHLENFNPQYPGNSGQGTYGAGSVRETINDDMKDAILGMNWDSFYEKYIPYVDEIIDAAREQKVIFVCIEHESCWYPNFSSRLSSDADTNSETTSDKELDETNSGGNEAGNNSNSSDTDPDRCVETEDVHRKPETMKTEIQADLESYKNHIDTQIENFEAAKNDLKKEMEQKVVQLESEIKCSLSKTTDANQQKVDELQNEIQQKMDDLKLYLEEKIENHVTILKQVVSDNLKELDSKIEEKVEKKFEELQNELRTRKEESDRELEERLKQMIAVTVEKRLEEKFEEMRNEKNESERKIRERFEKASGRSQAQKDSSMNSETSEVPDGEEIKSETSGGSVDDDQHGSGSSISVETTPAANGEEHVDQQINEQEQDPEGTEQDHVSDVSEGSISVESITAIGMKRIAQEVSDLDVEPDGVNQDPQGSSEESEEEDIEQLLAKQNQFYEEKFKKIRDSRIQKKQKEEEELEEMAANMRARYSFR
ncbi:hypothetical protein L3Y34_006179 [Caenorhabditis briggsae]|uniref:Uncharacterized protein n=1 Tax=Caenorhabditis briggsae TaxID=6238 RepID=A0AAE9A3D8_CAEBR|nr:hypothetical protein L3Y34_006179 [Caenorhabditis briggsae]